MGLNENAMQITIGDILNGFHLNGEDARNAGIALSLIERKGVLVEQECRQLIGSGIPVMGALTEFFDTDTPNINARIRERDIFYIDVINALTAFMK